MGLKPLKQRATSAPATSSTACAQAELDPGRDASSCKPAQDLRIGGRGSSAQYQYTIQSENLDDLVKWGPMLLQQDEKAPGLHRRQHRPAE
jgi:multidrug efflux pump